MTVVNPKSISGINSITTGSGSDNLLTIHTSDANNTERVRVNSSGDVIVGSGVTLSPDGDAFFTGVCTATTFKGDGSQLSNITSTTINNNADNRLITGSGTANTLEGESNLIFDGSSLGVGTTPETDGQTGSIYLAGGNANFWGSGNANLYSVVNARYTGSNWKYNNNGVASYVGQQSGVWNFFNAASGTADAAATFTERFRITAGGQVNIGNAISNTSRMLAVETTHASGGEVAYFGNNDSSDNYGGLLISAGEIDRECRLESAFGSSFMTFHTNSGEKLRLTSNGYLTNSGSNSVPTSGSAWGFATDQLYLSTGGTGANYALRFYNDNGLVGSALVNGSGTTFNTSSDYRLKENAVTISDGITRLKQLKPYRFNFKADASTTLDGFFAHEAQSVVPEAVTGTKDQVANADDVADGLASAIGNPVHQGIDQSKLVPLLTAALQEAVTKIEALESRVATLEGS